jgi:hypothetical protein
VERAREILPEFSAEQHGDVVEVSFTRDVNDDQLGSAISLLNENGAKIVDVETEQATLLDVLEALEEF